VNWSPPELMREWILAYPTAVRIVAIRQPTGTPAHQRSPSDAVDVGADKGLVIMPTHDPSQAKPPRHHPDIVTEEESLTAVEQRQELLSHHVRLLARGLSVGLFLYGLDGLGKSRIVLRTPAGERFPRSW
jgi:hypothetical protein